MSNQETSLVAMRFARLNSNGNGLPQAGASNGWALTDPIKIDVTFNYDSGTDVVQKDGAGRLCFVRKRPDNLKNATTKFETCGGDPKLLELIINGDGQTIGGNTVTGFGLQNATCNSAIRQGVFIEWWTEQYNCNSVDPTNPNARHFLPRVICNYDGGTWDEARHAYAFTGICQAGVVNANDASTTATYPGATAGGPFNDIAGFPKDEAFLYGYTVGQSEDQILARLLNGDYNPVPAQS